MRKAIFMVAISLIAGLTSFSQAKQVVNKTTVKTVDKPAPKKLQRDMVFKVMDGMDQWVNFPVKVHGIPELDSLFGKKSYDLVEWSVMTAVLELKHQMKDKYSFKPLPIKDNSVIYFKSSDGNEYIVVDVAAEAKNGYGNPISKKYIVWLVFDRTNPDLYKSLTLDRIS